MAGGNPALVQASATPHWVADAACGSTDVELFFDKGQEQKGATPDRISRENINRREQAKSVCRSCPVIERCREHYIDEPHGVFGGLDKDERHELREARRAIRNHDVDPEQVGREAYAAHVAGEMLTAVARRYGMRTRQLRTYMDYYLTTPAGLRSQLEQHIREAHANGLSDEQMAFKFGIPIAKAAYIRRKLGLADQAPVSQGQARMNLAGHSSYVTILGRVYPAIYLGESGDDPPFYFMQVKYPQASTRKWMRSEDVVLADSVRRHQISKGVGSGKKRTADSAGDGARPSGEAVA